jgi:dCMP deaminase
MNINELKNPSWDELFMRHAYLIASKSKDPRTQIGAVLVRERRVISEGYNGLPQGVNDDVEERQQRPLKYMFFEHAERNAVYGCARFGFSSAGSTMYTQGIPCADCARGTIQGGIIEIVTHKPWEDIFATSSATPTWQESCNRSKEMLLEAGIKLRTIDDLLGLNSKLDGKVVNI